MIKVTAAILKKDDLVLIAQRKADDKLAGKWEFPGGKIELGETPEQCLTREIKEEFNIDIMVGEYFGDSTHCYGDKTVYLMAFWAKWLGGKINATAHDHYKWVSVGELSHYDFAAADLPFVEKLLTNDTKER